MFRIKVYDTVVFFLQIGWWWSSEMFLFHFMSHVKSAFSLSPLLLDSFPECFIFNVFQCCLPLQGSTFDPACRHQSSANKSLEMFGHRDTAATSSTSICSDCGFFVFLCHPALDGSLPILLCSPTHCTPFVLILGKQQFCCMHHGAFGSTFESRVNPFFCFCLHRCPKVFVVNWFQVQNLKKPIVSQTTKIYRRSVCGRISEPQKSYLTDGVLSSLPLFDPDPLPWFTQTFECFYSPPFLLWLCHLYVFEVCLNQRRWFFPPPDCVNWIKPTIQSSSIFELCSRVRLVPRDRQRSVPVSMPPHVLSPAHCQRPRPSGCARWR